MVHICLVYGCVCTAPSAFSGDPVANRGKKKIGTGRSSYDSILTVTAECIQPGSWSTESLVITAGSHCLWILRDKQVNLLWRTSSGLSDPSCGLRLVES